ncbi:hypothetical protein [Kushneria marisflavi]|uniref:Uncharacterized protein n=1 Tax=Kushneria marisflavi TaxID=157779 RepID=A0A240UU29_9GAMM|nr:hypothetical protein [Kushneria marisflavi]ART64539.1 hypothetical protein B9H00_02325 [Kushneria marisflavi]RKD87116.1 hypothetical protein C8D96_0574 [Kushneria marisflavi]
MMPSLKGCVTVLLLLLSLSARADGSLLITQAGSDMPLAQAVVEIMLPDRETATGKEDGYQIVQRGAQFDPLVTVIPVGASVTFPNQDTTRHQVFSFSPPKVFSLDLYLRETPPPVSFERPGVEVLGCNIHDSMQAFIVISEAPFFTMTDKSGRIELNALPPGRYSMRIWHPRLDDTHQQWWQGEVDTRIDNHVALTLAATPTPSSEPSLLQQRFQRGLEHREYP